MENLKALVYGRPTNAYQRALAQKEFEDLVELAESSIPIDDIGVDMVKRWYQKLTGLGYDEMRKDIEAMVEALDWDRNINWD
jgi:hypothetical protein